MKTFKRNILTMVIILSGFLFLAGCASKAQIGNMLKDADYTFSEGKYEEARGLYKEILKVDPENRDAQYKLKDLEKVCANNDQGLVYDLHTNLASGMFLPDTNAKEVPIGDYSLEEFLDLAGDGVRKYVFNMFGAKSSQEISDRLLSVDQDGNPIKGKEIRVGYYENNTWSVYIPGSYDIGREEIIYSGVKPKNIYMH